MIRSAAGQDVDIPSGSLALRCIIETRLDPQLFERIRRWNGDISKIIVAEVVRIDAVDNQVVVRTALTIYEDHWQASARCCRIGKGGRCTRIAGQQEKKIAGKQWKIPHDITRERLAESGVRGVYGLDR